MNSSHSTMPPGRANDNGGVDRLVVLGASAGGLEALITIVQVLPDDLDAAVCLVLHTSPSSRGRLATVLGRRARIPVAFAEDGAPLERGRVYVAPADHHLVIERGIVRLTRGPRENRQRPAIDVLFRSAAYTYGPGVIGVVLTGALDDGTAGLWTIKDRGGVAVVQDPDEALFPSMPASAREYVAVDHVAPVAAIGPLLARLVGDADAPASGARPVSKELETVTAISKGSDPLEHGVLELGPMTPFTCPDCSGVLVRLKEGGVPTFRCHTGHAYSFDTLTAAATEHTEEMLWNALRAVEEVVLLMQQSAEQARERRDERTASAARRHAEETRRRADLLRGVLQQHRALAQAVLGGEGDAGSGNERADDRAGDRTGEAADRAR